MTHALPTLSRYDPALAEATEGDADDDIAVIVRLANDAELPSYARQVSRFGDIATARVLRSRLRDLVECDAVESAEASRNLRSSDEQTITELVDALPDEPETRRPDGVSGTGRGVIVACLDWGCDFAFPDFIEPASASRDAHHQESMTRLLVLWDQRASAEDAEHPNRFGYGRIYTRDEINAALRADDPHAALGYDPSDADSRGRGGEWTGAHGTHVLSIAAGNGRGGGPRGVAPEADLIFVHLSRTTPVLSPGNLGDSATVLEALDAVFEIAGDRPCVVNMSVGAHGGPHDGTTHVEAGIDRAVTMRPNRAIVNSAGNYQRRRAHAEGRLRQDDVESLQLQVPPNDPTDSEIELFYESPDRFAVAVLGPNEEEFAVVRPDEDAVLLFEDQDIGHVYHRSRHLGGGSGDRHVDIFLRRAAPAGEWTLRLYGERVSDGRYHAWIERDRGLSPTFGAASAVARSTTGTLCNGLHSITVGATDPFSARLAFGEFSSSGPTRDGRMKPEIVAPGVRINAAQSTPPGERPAARYIRKGGTSMAAPHVTGAVALMYEAAAEPLDIADLRALLFSSVDGPRASSHLSAVELHRLGHGVLNIAAAEAAAAKWRGDREHPLPETVGDVDVSSIVSEPPAMANATNFGRTDMQESDQTLPEAWGDIDPSLLATLSSRPDAALLLQTAATLMQQQNGNASWPQSIVAPTESNYDESFVAPSAITDWRDLIRFHPPAAIVRAIGGRRPFYYTVQTIRSASSDNINLDFYPVYVSRMPRLRGRLLDAASLFSHFRQNINEFIDTDLSEFEGASTADTARWASATPLGAVIYIDIKGPDNAYVVCSESGPRHWRFSTLSKHMLHMGNVDEHPVSGTREFGYQGTADRAVFYTKGADRGTFTLEWMNRKAFEGGHQLWVSFQREFVNWVNRHGGRAARFAFGSRPDVFISQRHNWRAVDRAV